VARSGVKIRAPQNTADPDDDDALAADAADTNDETLLFRDFVKSWSTASCWIESLKLTIRLREW